MPADSELWIPPLSPKGQKGLNRQHRLRKLIKWSGLVDKTPWDLVRDLLGILLVPLVIAGATIWFSAQQSQSSTQASDKQHQTDLQIANDQQQETALQTYLDRMSDLLLNSKLRESQPGDEVRNVARTRTLTILPQLNGKRKGELVGFLYEARLIKVENTIVDLIGADLIGADLIGADLSDANLSDANFFESNLAGADLRSANLRSADLGDADFAGADLRSARLIGARLNNANLRGTDLSGADFSHTDLYKTDLRGAKLNGADLRGAYFWDTYMPDGSKHS